ncbi:ribonuclease R [Fodinicurvata sp. EGI_FJ10296]|uniref:ribonuclease R n=1 Tax=Fodinicurvata sp. EGI_FJ10296 TaxID=3231908 RepID=UPI00345362D7
MTTDGNGFPTREQIIDFVTRSNEPVTKREIARAFNIRGDDRRTLKATLKEMERDGSLDRTRGKALSTPGQLPPVLVALVESIDADGELIARPMTWNQEGPPPRIFLSPDGRGHARLSKGDKALIRIRELEPPPENGDSTDETPLYEGSVIRILADSQASRDVVGIFHASREGGRISPATRGRADDLAVSERDRLGAEDGDIVVAEIPTSGGMGREPGRRPRQAIVRERLGHRDDPAAITEIAIRSAEIPTAFPDAALRQASDSAVPPLEGRTDLRTLPLVTIDGADARDFDDAVHACPDDKPDNPDGWLITVAIADVAAYVPAGSPLDTEAFNRGNSCYFPNRVVPMLPEALSNGVCSLVPGEDRACIAVRMRIASSGRLLDHRFMRGLMRSQARLTYEQVQSARNGLPDDTTSSLGESVIDPLYGAFSALAAARDARGTLDLDLPEHVVSIVEDGPAAGTVAGIGLRARLDSHKLIEEFMIAANVAAAETLVGKRVPCLFRVHDSPDQTRLEALREFLQPLGYSLKAGPVERPGAFAHILSQASGRPEADVVNQMILRSQAQANYSPDNIGHFGLALPQYAHFTSPIRRYADLTVHRGLIRALGLGPDGAPDAELERLEPIGEHISLTERRAAQAERDAVDRFVAAYLGDRVGTEFAGRISGVTRFGLFVSLQDTGADGLVPISTLPDDYYDHDEHAHALIGRRWGLIFRLGASVKVKLVEADPMTGSTLFSLMDAKEGADPFEGVLPTPSRHAPAGRRAATKRPIKRSASRTKRQPGKRRKP